MSLQIMNVMLSSINGKIALHSNESSAQRLEEGFACSQDFERMQKIVAQCDVVFIGAHSIECERGAFRVAHLRQEQTEPEWIIFTRTGNISFKSPFWNQKNIIKSIFFVTSFNMEEEPILRVEEKKFNFGTITCYLGNMLGLKEYLVNKKYKKAALLGGGKLNSAFWENNLVDELYLTLSPFVVGGDDSPNLLNMSSFFKKKLILKKYEARENFIFLDYSVEEN